MSHSATDIDPGRHAASWFRGLRFGLVALICSLLWPAWILNLFASQSNSVTLENNDALTFLGVMLLSYAGVPAALGFGAIAIRKNRALGKVFGILAILIALAVIAYHVLSVLISERYLPMPTFS